MKPRSLAWVSEDSEDVGVSLLPRGSLLKIPTPASQVHVKPLSFVATSCTVKAQRLRGCKPWSSQAKAEAMWAEDGGAPSLEGPHCRVVTSLQRWASVYGGLKGMWQNKALRMPSKNQRLVQQGHLYNCYLQCLWSCLSLPSLPLFSGLLYFIGKREQKLWHKCI